MAALRDFDVFMRIREVLLGTGRFAEAAIRVNEIWDWGACPSDCETFAFLWTKSWKEEDQSMWGDCSHERTVKCGLAIGIRELDPLRRLDKIGQLESLIGNALTGHSLGGCVQAKTRVSSGDYEDRPKNPAQVCVMEVSFSYFVRPDKRDSTTRYGS